MNFDFGVIITDKSKRKSGLSAKASPTTLKGVQNSGLGPPLKQKLSRLCQPISATR